MLAVRVAVLPDNVGTHRSDNNTAESRACRLGGTLLHNGVPFTMWVDNAFAASLAQDGRDWVITGRQSRYGRAIARVPDMLVAHDAYDEGGALACDGSLDPATVATWKTQCEEESCHPVVKRFPDQGWQAACAAILHIGSHQEEKRGTEDYKPEPDECRVCGNAIADALCARGGTELEKPPDVTMCGTAHFQITVRGCTVNQDPRRFVRRRVLEERRLRWRQRRSQGRVAELAGQLEGRLDIAGVGTRLHAALHGRARVHTRRIKVDAVYRGMNEIEASAATTTEQGPTTEEVERCPLCRTGRGDQAHFPLMCSHPAIVDAVRAARRETEELLESHSQKQRKGALLHELRKATEASGSTYDDPDHPWCAATGLWMRGAQLRPEDCSAFEFETRGHIARALGNVYRELHLHKDEIEKEPPNPPTVAKPSELRVLTDLVRQHADSCWAAVYRALDDHLASVESAYQEGAANVRAEAGRKRHAHAGETTGSPGKHVQRREVSTERYACTGPVCTAATHAVWLVHAVGTPVARCIECRAAGPRVRRRCAEILRGILRSSHKCGRLHVARREARNDAATPKTFVGKLRDIAVTNQDGTQHPGAAANETAAWKLAAKLVLQRDALGPASAEEHECTCPRPEDVTTACAACAVRQHLTGHAGGREPIDAADAMARTREARAAATRTRMPATGRRGTARPQSGRTPATPTAESGRQLAEIMERHAAIAREAGGEPAVGTAIQAAVNHDHASSDGLNAWALATNAKAGAQRRPRAVALPPLVMDRIVRAPPGDRVQVARQAVEGELLRQAALRTAFGLTRNDAAAARTAAASVQVWAATCLIDRSGLTIGELAQRNAGCARTNKSNHWFTVVVDAERGAYTVLNTMEGSMTGAHRDAAWALAHAVARGAPSAMHTVTCPQQKEHWECGYLSASNQAAVVLGIPARLDMTDTARTCADEMALSCAARAANANTGMAEARGTREQQRAWARAQEVQEAVRRSASGVLFAAADPEGRPLRVGVDNLVLDTAGARGQRATPRGDGADDLSEEEDDEDKAPKHKGKGKRRRTTAAGSSRDGRPLDEAERRAGDAAVAAVNRAKAREAEETASGSDLTAHKRPSNDSGAGCSKDAGELAEEAEEGGAATPPTQLSPAHRGVKRRRSMEEERAERVPAEREQRQARFERDRIRLQTEPGPREQGPRMAHSGGATTANTVDALRLLVARKGNLDPAAQAAAEAAAREGANRREAAKRTREEDDQAGQAATAKARPHSGAGQTGAATDGDGGAARAAAGAEPAAKKKHKKKRGQGQKSQTIRRRNTGAGDV